MKQINAALDKEFITVADGEGRTYYGGDQGWLKQKFAKKAGCGAVAAANVLLYAQGKRRTTKEEFVETTNLIRRYVPIIPFLGMNPLMVAICLSSAFKKKKLKGLVLCNILPINIYKKISKMLAEGFPVILAIGRNFPLLGGKKKLKLYIREGQNYTVTQEINAHFVTITAINNEWLTVSSWGRKYYIKKKELTKYAWLNSSWLFTNIIRISR